MSTEQQKGAGLELGEGSLLDQILSRRSSPPATRATRSPSAACSAFIAEMLAPKPFGSASTSPSSTQMIAEIDKRSRRRSTRSSTTPPSRSSSRVARPQVPHRQGRLPREHQGRGLNCSKEDLLAGLRGLARGGEVGPLPHGLLERVRHVRRQAVRPDGLELRLRPRPAGHGAPVRSARRGGHGPRAVHRERGAADVRHRQDSDDLPEPARTSSRLFEGPQYARWQAFRESEDARYVGLTLPRFLLRLPYGQNTVPTKAFNFEEDVIGKHDSYLWGNASIAFATRVADVREVPLVPEHHRPAGRRHGRGAAPPPVRGDGRDPDEDPDRDPAHGAP
jgi:type VI secretion system protein ImpC